MSLAAKVLALFLAAQAAAFTLGTRPEIVPAGKELGGMRKQHAGWQAVWEGKVTDAEQEVLKADDTLLRAYVRGGDKPQKASLYIASFLTQRAGRAPHSPKNCLPGAGWSPSESTFVKIDVPGRPEPLEVNKYVIAKGENRSVVLYWYQSRDRSVASEYWAKYWVVMDALRYNRTDSALVRVIVDVTDKDLPAAEKAAEEFVRSAYGDIRGQLPG